MLEFERVPQSLDLLKPWKSFFEIRYPAASRLFDRRGALIEQFQAEPFTDWRIQRNRVDLYDREHSISVFAGFRNAGGVAEKAPTASYFRDHIHRWLRLVIPELKIGRIERIGFRSIFFPTVEVPSSEELANAFMTACLVGGTQLWGMTTAKARDVCAIVDFEAEKYKLHMTTGPMEQEQARGYFESSLAKDELPNFGIFVDVDCYVENPEYEQDKVMQMSMRFVTEAQQILQAHVGQFTKLFDGIGVV